MVQPMESPKLELQPYRGAHNGVGGLGELPPGGTLVVQCLKGDPQGMELSWGSAGRAEAYGKPSIQEGRHRGRDPCGARAESGHGQRQHYRLTDSSLHSPFSCTASGEEVEEGGEKVFLFCF